MFHVPMPTNKMAQQKENIDTLSKLASLSLLIPPCR
jgi:hypothetical protein